MLNILSSEWNGSCIGHKAEYNKYIIYYYYLKIFNNGSLISHS
jgi:hypothetical protein